MSDVVGSYLKGNFVAELQGLIESYEEYTGIDAFFNNSASPKYFYEWTVQGMTYALITQAVGLKPEKTLLLLEQPYTANNAQVRSDIMWVELATGNGPNHGDLIHALELKTDYSSLSVQSDLSKLAAQIKAGTIATGYMVFLYNDDGDDQTWVAGAANHDPDVKHYLGAHQLFAIPVKAQQE